MSFIFTNPNTSKALSNCMLLHYPLKLLSDALRFQITFKQTTQFPFIRFRFIAFISFHCLFAPEMVQPFYVSRGIISNLLYELILIQYRNAFVLSLFVPPTSIHINLVVQTLRLKTIGKQK